VLTVATKEKKDTRPVEHIGMFSGGKDSLVACHYADVQEVIYCKTGIGLPENEQFVAEQCAKYGWKLHVLTPKEGNSYEDFIERFGFPKPRIHAAVMSYLKWFPLRKWARENAHRNIVFVTGRRSKESKRRMQVTGREKSKGGELVKVEKNITCYAPLLDWSTEQVWRYIKENNMDVCPVYQTLHLSGDCLCGAFAGIGESDLIATFYPQMAERIKTLEEKTEENFRCYLKGQPSKTRIGLRREMRRWGKGEGHSMSMALKQDKIESFVCSDCLYDSNM